MDEEKKLEFEKEGENEEKEMSSEDFQGGDYIKNPLVGESIILDVEKVVDNPNIEGKNNETGAAFTIGLKDKNNKVKRVDIHTSEGVYTISSWEVYFKLFDSRKETLGLLMDYAGKHGKSFKGAKVKILHNMDGRHASQKIDELAKILDMSEEEAKKYQDDVKLAMKERRLYTVTIVE